MSSIRQSGLWTAPPPIGREASSISTAEAFARVLVGLTRTVWQPECTFDTAVSAICRAGAEALAVERVTLWNYEPTALRLLSLCESPAQQSDNSEPQESLLPLEGDDYVAVLQDVRTLKVQDLQSDTQSFISHRALQEYLDAHGIGALLVVPVVVEGQLLAVLSHESADPDRVWLPEDSTFAASLGDYIGMAFEIVRRRAAEDQVRHLRLYDSATGLPRREFLEEALRQRLAAPHASTVPAVLHVRVDASSGAALSADAPTESDILARVGARLRAVCSADMALARVHTNGFACVLPAHASQSDAIRLAERCLDVVRSLAAPSDETPPSAGVGIAFAYAPHADARMLLRQAEEAADQARLVDKFAFEVYDLQHHAVVMDRLRQERDLRVALDNDDFELHYQPEYDASTCQWVAAEALLRWRVHGVLLEAADFIATVETSGLILPLGAWVLRRACEDASAWPTCSDGTPAIVRVNVSARQFDAGGLIADVAGALQATGLDPARLCLEITETTLMKDMDHAQHVLEAITRTGVRVAIDDFGTGYASLVYLKRLPARVLKIDRAFVSGLPGDLVDTAIVAAVTGLASALGIDVIAEGVETLEQQRALQAVGVRRMQGWLYARAMSQSALCDLLSAAPPQWH